MEMAGARSCFALAVEAKSLWSSSLKHICLLRTDTFATTSCRDRTNAGNDDVFFADFNGDGHLDILSIRANPVHLLRAIQSPYA